MLQLKKFPDIPVSTPEEGGESRPHPEGPRFCLLAREGDPFPAWSGKNSQRSRRISRGGALHRKARGTSGSCHHSQSPPDVSVHSRETCFPCTASTFKPRIESHHVDTWDSPVGKPRGNALRESHRSLDPRERICDTAATAREESARACPHSRQGLTPLGDSRRTPRSMSALERNPQDPAPTPHKVLGPGIEGRGIPRGPGATRMGTGLS